METTTPTKVELPSANDTILAIKSGDIDILDAYADVRWRKLPAELRKFLLQHYLYHWFLHISRQTMITDRTDYVENMVAVKTSNFCFGSFKKLNIEVKHMHLYAAVIYMIVAKHEFVFDAPHNIPTLRTIAELLAHCYSVNEIRELEMKLVIAYAKDKLGSVTLWY